MPGQIQSRPSDTIRENEQKESSRAVQSLEKAAELMREVERAGGQKAVVMKKAEEAYEHTKSAQEAIRGVHTLRSNQK